MQTKVHPCCPPGHGCNAPHGTEPCALEVCGAAAAGDRDAAKAVARWSSLQRAHERGRSEGELRFRRRAFERARDRALIAVALSSESSPSASPVARGSWRGRRRRRSGSPMTPAGRAPD